MICIVCERFDILLNYSLMLLRKSCTRICIKNWKFLNVFLIA